MQITPHSDFGLGLRLEAQAEGLPAVAGSYKKHPLTGGRLPAERAGKLTSDFAHAARHEDHFQNILQVVEADRKMRPNLRRKGKDSKKSLFK